ncbi:hypothetical protein ES708_11579 [subsurface metagenome]
MYEKCWDRLVEELNYLSSQKVHSMDPQIVLGYMNFLLECERYKVIKYQAELKEQADAKAKEMATEKTA